MGATRLGGLLYGFAALFLLGFLCATCSDSAQTCQSASTGRDGTSACNLPPWSMSPPTGCVESLDAYCNGPAFGGAAAAACGPNWEGTCPASCVFDFAVAKQRFCAGSRVDCSISQCGEFEILGCPNFGDTGHASYYDVSTGKLIAIDFAGGGGSGGCVGPSDFAIPECRPVEETCETPDTPLARPSHH
jgi:hypothetical protein